MKIEKVAFEKTNQFSKIFIDYITNQEALKPFYNRTPEIDNFEDQIKSKSFSTAQRIVLHEDLVNQYRGLSIDDAVEHNLNVLKEDNTFTITTGHQLNIFTGPLYFIYKIVSVINTCKDLKAKYPKYNFVPVYWMASEDHDFEEISYFRLNGKKIKWDTEQLGAVGRFNPKELKSIIEETAGIPEFFEKAYLKNKNLADAAREYVDYLFGKYGLVVIDADSKSLKKEFEKVIVDDITNHTANELVTKQSEALDKIGYKAQVYPREINFFYLKDNLRTRIVKEGKKYQVLDSDISFSETEILEEVKQHPERFSPNVILRPLYQEIILPNLAYFGGPGELAYWFQLQDVFNHYKVSFPILMPRNFALVLSEQVQRKMEKADVALMDIFKPKTDLLKDLALAHAPTDVELNGQQASIIDLFDKIKNMAAAIDTTLVQHVEAQQTITNNKLDTIQKKFIRAEKKNQENRLRQAEMVIDTLFPNGVLQERTDNFLNFYLANPNFIDGLINQFEPFDFRFNVLIDGQ